MKNKKGISEVVAAVLLILLTVAAAATLIGFMKPFVEKTLSGTTRCRGYDSYVQFENKLDNGTGIYNYNCWQNNTNYYLTGISIKTDTLDSSQLSKIKGFFITLKSNSNDIMSFNITNSPPRNDLWIIGNKNMDINFNGPIETMTYVYNSSKKYDTAQVYVLLDSGLCTVSDSITLNSCNGVNLN